MSGISMPEPKGITCTNCRRRHGGRTVMAILHPGEMKGLTVLPEGKMEFTTTMRISHMVNLCHTCRKKLTVEELYGLVEE